MKTQILKALLLLLFPLASYAQTGFVSIKDGPFNDPSTWTTFDDPDDDGIPDADDLIFLNGGFTVTLSEPAECNSIEFDFDGSGGGQTTKLVLNSGAELTTNAVTISNSGAFDATDIAIIEIAGSSALLTVNGNFEITTYVTFNETNAQLQFTDAGTIDVSGTFSVTTAMVVSSGSGVNGTLSIGSSCTLPVDGSNIVYPNLTFNSLGGTLTLGNTLNTTRLKGNLTIENGTLNNNNFGIVGNTGKTFSLNNSSTYTITGSGGFATGFSSFSLSNSSTVNYNGTSSTISAKDYGNLIIAGSGAKTLAGASTVYGTLTVTGVTFNAGSALLTMTSDASHHASIAESTGSFSGTINMQRYVATTGYTILSTPATSASLSSFDDDINIYNVTGATPGTGNSNWFTYNEATSSYGSPTNVSDGITVGEGQLVYIESAPLTLDITGTPNSGTKTYSLSRTGDGYHLAGNPYNSDVLFNITNGNTSTNGYKINSARNGYTTLTSGASNIGAWEGIWIEATADPGEIQFTEANKSAGNVFNSRSGGNYNPYAIDMLYIHLYEGNTHKDRLTIKAAEDATDNFESRFDLIKFNNDPGVANIVGVVDGFDVSVNSWANDGALKTLPIRVFTDYPSNTVKSYSLVFENLNALTANNACYVLEDLVTGNTYHLNSDTDTISFSQSDAVTANRFVIHYSKPISATGTDLACYNSNDGKIVATGTGAGPFNYTWKDNNGQIIQTHNNVAGSDSLLNLQASSYSVTVANNANCPFVSTSISLNQPNEIIAAAIVDKDTANIFLNEGITVTNTSVNSNDFTILMGDGNSYSNQSPITHYYASPGTYTISIIATNNNGECSNSAEYEVNVINTTGINESISSEGKKLWLDAKNINIQLNDSWSNEDVTITATNELGQIVSSSKLNNHGSILTIDKPKTAGLYVIKVESVTKTYLRKIVIE